MNIKNNRTSEQQNSRKQNNRKAEQQNIRKQPFSYESRVPCQNQFKVQSLPSQIQAELRITVNKNLPAMPQ
jgi:hypothetical protein